MLAEVAALQTQFKALPRKHVELMDALRAVCWLQALLLHMTARLRRCSEPTAEAANKKWKDSMKLRLKLDEQEKHQPVVGWKWMVLSMSCSLMTSFILCLIGYMLN
ncbi:hypothetical protein Droror1_Dr00012202 [Drosera rotundifolia]